MRCVVSISVVSVVYGCVVYVVWGIEWCKPKLKCCCQGERNKLGGHTQPLIVHSGSTGQVLQMHLIGKPHDPAGRRLHRIQNHSP